jgi:glutathione S-transferase
MMLLLYAGYDMAKIQLYQWGPLANQESASPFCVKVQYAMRYKRLAFEIVNVTSPLLVRKLNPRRKLPVMVADGVTIADSSEIVGCLEANYPKPQLYPPEPQARAHALLIEDWADESLYWYVVYERWQVADQFEQVAEVLFSAAPRPLKAVIKFAVRQRVRNALRGQGLGRLSLKQQREKLGLALDWLDSMLDGQFLCGRDLSIADLAVAAQIAGLDMPFTPVVQTAVRERARLMRWLERSREAVSVKQP